MAWAADETCVLVSDIGTKVAVAPTGVTVGDRTFLVPGLRPLCAVKWSERLCVVATSTRVIHLQWDETAITVQAVRTIPAGWVLHALAVVTAVMSHDTEGVGVWRHGEDDADVYPTGIPYDGRLVAAYSLSGATVMIASCGTLYAGGTASHSMSVPLVVRALAVSDTHVAFSTNGVCEVRDLDTMEKAMTVTRVMALALRGALLFVRSGDGKVMVYDIETRAYQGECSANLVAVSPGAGFTAWQTEHDGVEIETSLFA